MAALGAVDADRATVDACRPALRARLADDEPARARGEEDGLDYSNRVRGSGQPNEAEAEAGQEPGPRRRCPPSWARLIARVYQVDPLVCTRCGQRMNLIAFVTDQMAIGKILEHLGLSTPEAAKPPPPAPELLRVAEHGDGWGTPQQWDPA
jgi:hypothetical protein